MRTWKKILLTCLSRIVLCTLAIECIVADVITQTVVRAVYNAVGNIEFIIKQGQVLFDR